jgi:hypothetical protein
MFEHVKTLAFRLIHWYSFLQIACLSLGSFSNVFFLNVRPIQFHFLCFLYFGGDLFHSVTGPTGVQGISWFCASIPQYLVYTIEARHHPGSAVDKDQLIQQSQTKSR